MAFASSVRTFSSGVVVKLATKFNIHKHQLNQLYQRKYKRVCARKYWKYEFKITDYNYSEKRLFIKLIYRLFRVIIHIQSSNYACVSFHSAD